MQRFDKQLKTAGLTLLFGLGLACLRGSYMLTEMMGNLTAEQILFHLMTPVKGVSPEITWLSCIFLLEILAWTLLFWCFCSGWLEGCLQKLLHRTWNLGRWRKRICGGGVAVLWGGMLVFVGCNHGVGTFAYNLLHPSKLIDEHYVKDPVATFKAPEKKHNLVVIVSESLERTYENKTFFGANLLQELQKREKHGMCFLGQIEVNGTDSTISSIEAILYGMPRLLIGMEGWHNYIQGNIFHGTISILHVLRNHGYDIWHIQGGDLDFAGTRDLFEDFPQAHLFGKEELQEDPEYCNLVRQKKEYGWGINDKITLRIAREKMTEAAKHPPFFMSISTLDSHYDGYLQEGEQQLYHDFRDIVRAQSRLLDEFLAWLAKQPFATDTTVLLVGDHYVMREQVGQCNMESLTDGTKNLPLQGALPERTVYSCLFNGTLRKKGRENRQFCSFDWAPTLLESLGFQWPSRRFGLGVSLLSGERTLLEDVGGPAYERESRRRSRTYGQILSHSRQ